MTSNECPACKTPSTPNDKFCRSCGTQLLLQCSDCSKPVRPLDKFCGSCGKRRWYYVEAAKNLNKDTIITVVGVIGVIIGYGLLHMKLAKAK